ncbi:MAG: dihydrolipoyl dehydrogenase [Chitinophagales bacterium]|nr:dihydrolipoyl dehydrogenase [Chitinophagales bacterium]
MDKYDLIVLGAGPGGYVAAIRAAQLGLKTAIVEKENLGGVCLNWGCIPTKALLKSAQVYDYIHHAESYGFNAVDIAINFPEIINRSRSVANKMSKGIEYLMKKNKIDTYNAYGKLLPGTKIEITADDGTIDILSAKNIIIATGSKAKEIPSLPINQKNIINYRKAMTLETLPKTMVVVGAGAIGVEFAYFYQTLGTTVTLVEFFDQILPNEDAEVSTALQKKFTKHGMQVLTSSKVLSSNIIDGKVELQVNTPKGNEVIVADIVLSAIGIDYNIDNIGLEMCGIETEYRKIKTNAFYQTNIDNIYAIGDIVKGPALAHVASAEGIVAAEHIANKNPQAINYNNIPSCTYCSPEVASVGYTEKQCKEKGIDYTIGKFPYTASGKAQASGKPDGFVKVIVDKKYDEILGVHIIGDNATEMIAEIVVARNLEATGKSILHSIHPHPTMSEAIMEAFADAYKEAIHI